MCRCPQRSEAAYPMKTLPSSDTQSRYHFDKLKRDTRSLAVLLEKSRQHNDPRNHSKKREIGSGLRVISWIAFVWLAGHIFLASGLAADFAAGLATGVPT